MIDLYRPVEADLSSSSYLHCADQILRHMLNIKDFSLYSCAPGTSLSI